MDKKKDEKEDWRFKNFIVKKMDKVMKKENMIINKFITQAFFIKKLI